MTALIQGLIGAFQPEAILFTAAGTVLGIIFGALPGLTSTMAVALLIPVTFGLSPVAGMGMLMGAFCGGQPEDPFLPLSFAFPGHRLLFAQLSMRIPWPKKGKRGWHWGHLFSSPSLEVFSVRESSCLLPLN